ncbi:hypothetical protein C8J56DRAFT_892028 [Mycena floridula]|nr:hypothetical protein C8J56DRAFT_892028 [Mycena floridula]
MTTVSNPVRERIQLVPAEKSDDQQGQTLCFLSIFSVYFSGRRALDTFPTWRQTWCFPESTKRISSSIAFKPGPLEFLRHERSLVTIGNREIVIFEEVTCGLKIDANGRRAHQVVLGPNRPGGLHDFGRRHATEENWALVLMLAALSATDCLVVPNGPVWRNLSLSDPNYRKNFERRLNMIEGDFWPGPFVAEMGRPIKQSGSGLNGKKKMPQIGIWAFGKEVVLVNEGMQPAAKTFPQRNLWSLDWRRSCDFEPLMMGRKSRWGDIMCGWDRATMAIVWIWEKRPGKVHIEGRIYIRDLH